MTAIEHTGQPDRFIRRRELLAIVGIPQSTLYDLMQRNLFPRNVRASREHKRFVA